MAAVSQPPVAAAPVVELAAAPAVTTKTDIVSEIISVFGNGVLGQQALCIAQHESGFNPYAVNVSGNYPYGSRDRGVFQLNSYWHPEISDQMAFDPMTNIRLAYNMRIADRNWHQWSTRYVCHVQ